MPVVIITRLHFHFQSRVCWGVVVVGILGVWTWAAGREYVAGSSRGRNCCSKVVFGGASRATAGGTRLVVPGRSGGSLSRNRSNNNNAGHDHGRIRKGKEGGQEDGMEV